MGGAFLFWGETTPKTKPQLALVSGHYKPVRIHNIFATCSPQIHKHPIDLPCKIQKIGETNPANESRRMK